MEISYCRISGQPLHCLDQVSQPLIFYVLIQTRVATNTVTHCDRNCRSSRNIASTPPHHHLSGRVMRCEIAWLVERSRGKLVPVPAKPP